MYLRYIFLFFYHRLHDKVFKGDHKIEGIRYTNLFHMGVVVVGGREGGESGGKWREGMEGWK